MIYILLRKNPNTCPNCSLKRSKNNNQPISKWICLAREIAEEKVETVADFIFMGYKITVDCDCSHEIKRHLLLRRKGVTNLGSTLKSKDSTLPTKSCIVKAMVFPVVMFGCES